MLYHRGMICKHLLSVGDLSPGEIQGLVEAALKWKRRPMPQGLRGKTVAMLFEKPSLRTRVSFHVAVHQLGGEPIYLSGDAGGLGEREPVEDLARVLSRYVDAIIARTYSHGDLETLARYASVPVINALSDQEHPCQALADLVTILEKKGSLRGLTLAYIGDANNVASSLALACCAAGMRFVIASPEGYELSQQWIAKAQEMSRASGGEVICVRKPAQAAKEADVLYTDVWVSMGQEGERERRVKDLAGYGVTEELLGKAKPGALIMHPMPAHYGEEIEWALQDHPNSVMFDQAENRLHLQKVLLLRLLGEG